MTGVTAATAGAPLMDGWVGTEAGVGAGVSGADEALDEFPFCASAGSVGELGGMAAADGAVGECMKPASAPSEVGDAGGALAATAVGAAGETAGAGGVPVFTSSPGGLAPGDSGNGRTAPGADSTSFGTSNQLSASAKGVGGGLGKFTSCSRLSCSRRGGGVRPMNRAATIAPAMRPETVRMSVRLKAGELDSGGVCSGAVMA